MKIKKLASISNVLLGAAALAACACQSGRPGDGSAAPDAAPPEVMELRPLVAGPANDLGSNVALAQLSFTASGKVFRAGYQTHSVQIADGVVDVTPKSWDEVDRRQITGGAIGLETTRISAGDALLGSAASITRPLDGDAIEITRDLVTEQITNRDDGIEQSWRFESAPEGDGDLEVEIAVSGQDLVVANESGLHFKSPQGLGFRYSHGVWRDASGLEMEITARFEAGHIVLTIPHEIVEMSTFPAVLDPTITAELYTDVPAIGTTGTNSRNMDVASDGTQYFVVWQDQRASVNDDIFAARLNAAGAIVDSSGIAVNQAAGVQQNPTAAWVGNGWVVAWENVVGSNNSDIVAAFVSTSNAVTQLGTIAGTAANETVPTLIGRGAEALLVWQDGSNVLGARFSAGAFAAPFAIASGANVEKEPAGAANPAGDYLVTFTETVAAGNDDIRGQRVTAGGAVSGAVFNIANQTGAQTASATSFDGTNFISIWTTGGNIFGARVGPTGTLLDTTPVSINGATGSQLNPDVSCGTGSCLATWEDTRTLGTTSRDVFAALLTTTSALTVTTNDIAVTTAPRTQVSPALAIAGGQWLTAWTDARDFDTISIRGSRLSAAGAVLDAAGLTVASNTSRFGQPVIAQSSLRSDIYFSDSQLPDNNIVHVRFTSSQKDNPPKIVSNATAAQSLPTAAAVGTDFLAAWQDTRGVDRDIYMARVNQTTGVVIDAAGVPVTTATGDQFAPKMASAGATALIVWQDRRNSNFDVFGAIVNAAGAVVTTDIPICLGAGDQTRPTLAYDATNNIYLVVWSDPSAGNNDIRAARVSAAGAVLDAGCGTVVSGAAQGQFSPDVIFGANGQALVVWDDRRNDSLGDVFGSRVTTNGALTVLDPAGISISSIAGSRQTEPAVAFGGQNGGAYFVVWSDQSHLGTSLTDIRGSRVSNAGVVEASFTVSANPEDEHAPDVSSGVNAAAAFTVAYQKSRPDLKTERIQVRQVAFTSLGGQPCTSDAVCATGFCSDSKCCDTACGGFYNVTDCQACSVARGGAQDGVCSILPASGNFICRYFAETNPIRCDLAERCDGVSAACPPDIGRFQGQACQITGGGTGTCPLNSAAGAPHICQ